MLNFSIPVGHTLAARIPAGQVSAGAGERPPFTVSTLLTAADLSGFIAVGLVLAAGLYLYGVHRLRLRGDRWPIARTALFLLPGLGSIAAVTVTGIGAYDDTLISVHMVQHMVLSMIGPIFLALGAPVTLALRTLTGRPRRAVLTVLHSRYLRVVTFPLVAYAIFVVNPFALYFSGLYRLSLENVFVHEWVHLHFLLTGCVFFWPLLGLDPLPGRWPYPARALLMVLSVPFHTVLGLTIMQSQTLLGGDWYPSLGLSWSDPWSDQKVAGGILWAGGEVVSVTMLAVLVVQWMRQSEREARRVDRELDRAEARAARAATGGGHLDPGGADTNSAGTATGGGRAGSGVVRGAGGGADVDAVGSGGGRAGSGVVRGAGGGADVDAVAPGVVRGAGGGDRAGTDADAGQRAGPGGVAAGQVVDASGARRAGGAESTMPGRYHQRAATTWEPQQR